MKKLILLIAISVTMAAPQSAKAATVSTASTASSLECFFCPKLNPANRYAKAHKNKMFKGYKMTKQGKKNLRKAKRLARKNK